MKKFTAAAAIITSLLIIVANVKNIRNQAKFLTAKD